MAEGNFFSRLVGGLIGNSSNEKTDAASEKLLAEFLEVHEHDYRALSANLDLKASEVGENGFWSSHEGRGKCGCSSRRSGW